VQSAFWEVSLGMSNYIGQP